MWFLLFATCPLTSLNQPPPIILIVLDQEAEGHLNSFYSSAILLRFRLGFLNCALQTFARFAVETRCS